jgi:MFS transporter, DHA2 family, multidrug resistance protein
MTNFGIRTPAAASLGGSQAGANPWFVAAAVVVPTFMEVLDTTIAVVALRYIAGGLSATVDDGEWVITSYLAANAIILPISGWLAVRFGRRNYFLFSILVFTIASALCGMATSLNQLILFRVIQGLAGGGLQPSSQGVLLDAFPAEKQGTAMTLFGLAALVAPVVGPTLGGWITDDYSWRWVFYINVPIGLLAFAGCYAMVRDPDYLTTQRAEQRRQGSRFDSIGLSLLVMTMVCWEVMLSKGEEWNWFGDAYGRVQTLAAFFIVALGALIFWELRHRSPVVNFRPLRERNFVACCVIIFFAYAVLYGASTSLPGLLQSLFGYNALKAGLVMSPAGLFAILAMPVVAVVLRRQTDARWVIIVGLLFMAAGNYWMSLMNLDISPGQVVWPRVVTVAGLAICFAPANVAAYLYTPKELRGAAVGLLNLLRNEGGSVGTSLSQALHDHREQFHGLRLGEYLDPFNPAVQSFIDQACAMFLEQSGDPAAAQQLALQALDNLREQQASALAYFDCFWVFAMIMLALVPIVLLMKRSVAEKGARIGGE